MLEREGSNRESASYYDEAGMSVSRFILLIVQAGRQSAVTRKARTSTESDAKAIAEQTLFSLLVTVSDAYTKL